MGNKLTERLERQRKQRTKWRREVESAERDWRDCSAEDREQMRTELSMLLERLRPNIEASNVDDFTKADLVERVQALHQQVTQ
jgi:hypothetical protein